MIVLAKRSFTAGLLVNAGCGVSGVGGDGEQGVVRNAAARGGQGAEKYRPPILKLTRRFPPRR